MKRDTPKNITKSSSGRSDKMRKKIGVERFTFRNGDRYEGKYEIDVGKRTLVKQGWRFACSVIALSKRSYRDGRIGTDTSCTI